MVVDSDTMSESTTMSQDQTRVVMVEVYVSNESHTLSCMLRERLEQNHPDEYVGCSLSHPDDSFIRVDAPSIPAIRTALLQLMNQVAQARIEVENAKPPSAPKRSATPVKSTAGSAPDPVAPSRRSQRLNRQ